MQRPMLSRPAPRCRVMSTCAVIALAAAAHAQPIPEVEPNNAIPGPSIFPAGLPFYAVSGSIAPGDFDAFNHGPLLPFPNIVPVFGGCVSASTWTDPLGSGDTYLGEWFAGITPPFSAADDDRNPGLNPALQWLLAHFARCRPQVRWSQGNHRGFQLVRHFPIRYILHFSQTVSYLFVDLALFASGYLENTLILRCAPYSCPDLPT